MKANKTRKVHTQEFKAEALKLAERIGVAAAARELKVYESQLYSWRTAAQKKSSTSAREAEQAAEIARLKRQLAEQAEDLAIFKKGGHLLREEPKIARFEFILEHQHQFSLKRMVNVLNVSRSGYYAWRKHGQTVNPREQRQIERDEAIKQAFIDSKERSGARRIQVDLAELDMTPDIKTIRNSMIRQGFVPKAARKFKVTTDSKHNQPVAPNLLEQDFTASAPNQKWVGDITYLFTSEGWLYLAVIIDLYSRSVVGWSMSNRMTATLVCDALKMALFRRGFPEGIIVHSDRGSQYCSSDYRDLIKKHRLTQSMSRKGNCWDNACAESFFHSLKVEALQDEPIMDRENMRRAVFEYIEVDYNKTRRHSAIGYLSPENFELKNSA
ncbi:IS3 family transposase [Aliidiomarina sanyensis]|uniref:IS3 family transposase n=2 Tax=Idiomarinaceae TaxID=267893 RepID=A0A432W4X8_9GAMM|nr:IS3 family transposase [Aliidiomarina sanyensis]RUO24717.1 IS3 family transposase [Aliidiomarina sanyensis]